MMVKTELGFLFPLASRNGFADDGSSKLDATTLPVVMTTMVLCPCGSPTSIRTSCIATNPRRRFHCCARAGFSCGFVSWADPPMYARSSEIIPGLLRSINNHEEMGRIREIQLKRLKIVLVISWIFFVMYVVFG